MGASDKKSKQGYGSRYKNPYDKHIIKALEEGEVNYFDRTVLKSRTEWGRKSGEEIGEGSLSSSSCSKFLSKKRKKHILDENGEEEGEGGALQSFAKL